MNWAVRRMELSVRAQDRIPKLARTIADMDKSDAVSAKHFAEAAPFAYPGSHLALRSKT